MCGIAGILRVHAPGQAPPPHVAIPEAWLDILDESIKHRGPDGQGRFRDRAVRPDGSVVDVALVHRRLSILDHAGGAQPMVLPSSNSSVAHPTGSLRPCRRCAANGHGTIAVVFNGCIYNHRELRRELQAAGHEFSTDHSDTEVLVHGWGEWATELPTRLDGMFAAAIWDHARAELALARDLAGEKPLYRFGGAFASCIPGLVRLAPARGERIADPIHPTAIEGWVRFGALLYTPWGRNESEGIQAIEEVYPAGLWRDHFVRVGETGNTSAFREFDHARWATAFDGVATKSSGFPRRGDRGQLSSDAAERLLRTAVGTRLEADVPLACFLSGGLDSSLIAAFAQEHLRGAGRRLRTICVRMPDRAYDESEFATAVARQLGTDHLVLPA
ncbi:MAG: asparagine synthase-related protein, partial [Dehalococcoidia bacterium]